MISQKSIQDVLFTAKVEEVIEESVELKRRGANMIGLCPFHNEKTPSFTVSPGKNIYKCFGCGKGGGAVQFVMEQEQLSFPEAIRHLAKKYNIELEETQQKDEGYEEAKQKLESLNIINEYALGYFKEQLLETQKGKAIGLSYLKERGFLDKTIEQFGLGYSPDEYQHFTKTAEDRGYKIEFLKELGLTSKSGYDFFRGRIIFPIHNMSGKPIAYSGRTLSSSKKTPKYINSPESEVYLKRKTLYGLHLAKKSIRYEDNCYMVEGYSDVISLHQAGISNVVASSGTSLTEEQILLVKRMNTDNITLLYDGDKAGIAATLRAIDIVLQKDMNPYVLNLPEGEDPDTFINKHGHQGFLDFADEQRKDFLDYKADHLLKDVENDPIKKSFAIKELIQTIANITYPIKRDLYIQKCATIIGIDEQRIVVDVDKSLQAKLRLQENRARYQANRDRQEQQSSLEGNPVIHSNSEEYPESNKYKDFYQEKDLARITLQYGKEQIEIDGESMSVAEFIYTNIYDILDYFENQLYKNIIQESFDLVSKDDSFDTSTHFINHSTDDIRDFAITINANKYEYANWEGRKVELQTQMPPEQNFQKDSYQAILHFKFRKMQKVIENLIAKMKTDDLSEEDKLTYLKAFSHLQEQKMELAKELNLVIP